MRIALCNEVLRELEFAAQCALAKGLGYDGLEVAPFTLSEQPHRLPQVRRAELRRIAGDHGIAITGLHYLLLAPEGLSITSPDPGVRARTIEADGYRGAFSAPQRIDVVPARWWPIVAITLGMLLLAL